MTVRKEAAPRLVTTELNGQTMCELVRGAQVEARGAVKDGFLVGPWETYWPDGRPRFRAEVTGAAIATSLVAEALRENLTLALLQSWLATLADPPEWMMKAGVFDVQWTAIEDPSRLKTVKRFTTLMHGAFCPEPMVSDFCLRGLHLGTVDDRLFPVTPIVLPFLVEMLLQPGAPQEWLSMILDDIGELVGDHTVPTAQTFKGVTRRRPSGPPL